MTRREHALPLLDEVLLTAAFESLPDAMLLVEPDGSVALVNQRACDVFGYRADELIGQSVDLLVPTDRRAVHEAHHAGYQNDPITRPMGRGLQLQGRRQDGTTFPVDISLGSMPLDDGALTIVAARDISDQRRIEETLAAHAFVVQSSDDAIFQVDPEGNLISWNPGATRLSGYEPDAALGRSPEFLFPVHRREEEAEVLQRALHAERVERHETEVQRADGLVIPVEITCSPLRAQDSSIVGASIIAHDITEQRLAQDALAASEGRLHEAQQLASVGLWSWDIASGTVQWSEPLYHVIGGDPRDFDGTLDGFLARIDDADRNRLETAFWDAAAGGADVDVECGVQRDDGPGWMSVRAEVVLGSGGQTVGLSGIAQDITERRRAADALQDALDRERAASERLREADHLKDEFLATVSHELRTPLTSIVGFTGVLVEHGFTHPQAATMLERVLHNAGEMQRMIEGLLDFTRLEAGRVVLDILPVGLAGAVRDAVESVEAQLFDHEVEIDIAPELLVRADVEALRRILVNLLTNAAKFSPLDAPIEVGASGDGFFVDLWVRDRGPGITADAQAHVFERFFQVNATRQAGRRGTGIGLAVVQRFVQMLGGEVRVESAPGEGSTFFVRLPAAEARG